VRIARRIQLFSLPRLSRRLRERGIAARTLPSLEVSGDYYDFMEREDGSVLVAVADVSGKGIPAALILSSLRTAFHLGARSGDDPARWCDDLNALLHDSLRDTEFVTGVFGVLSPDRRRFRYCNAGHNPPFRVPGDGGEVELLETGGMILGAFAEAVYEEGTVDLAPGDRLVFYTDGVTEAMDPAGEEFGPERLVETVVARPGRTAAEVVGAVVRAVRRFGGRRLADDLTVVVMGGPDAP
jgi:sigma-B regulation protein RsbU (phosphoserine phosphatase)